MAVVSASRGSAAARPVSPDVVGAGAARARLRRIDHRASTCSRPGSARTGAPSRSSIRRATRPVISRQQAQALAPHGERRWCGRRGPDRSTWSAIRPAASSPGCGYATTAARRSPAGSSRWARRSTAPSWPDSPARCVPGDCPLACQQLEPGSDLLDALNAGDETPAGPTLRVDLEQRRRRRHSARVGRAERRAEHRGAERLPGRVGQPQRSCRPTRWSRASSPPNWWRDRRSTSAPPIAPASV